MPPEPRVTEDQLRCLAQLVGIEISPGHAPGVIRNLEILLGQAALLEQTPLEPAVEPAAVYRA